ncbi:MAG: hypothetical protein K2H43_02675 [Clostridia bacterium]|nr:hypothetical protein [Clostridia bacterium]
MKLKKLLTVSAAALVLLSCSGCFGGSGGGSGNEGDPETPSDVNKFPSERAYVVYDANDKVKYETDNVFAAFIKAGKLSTRSNRHSVWNGKETIFTFSTGKYYQFIGSEFVGTMDCDAANEQKSIAAAKAWAKKNPNSYVVNSTATEYVALGRSDMENSSIADDTFGLEFESGSYVYAYSKRNDADPSFPGVSYMEFTLDMTDMEFKYHESESEKDWNAYIFSNFFTTSPWGCCDIGLIASSGQTLGTWYPVFNYNGTMVTPEVVPITEMKYDEEAGCWRGTDVIEFRAYATRDAYHMEFNNLTTGKKFSFSQSDARQGALQHKADKAFTLLAASYCPVVQSTRMWDARSGAVFKGLKFRNPKVAGFIESATCGDDYNDAVKEDFLPSNTDVFGYGFAQAADNANYRIGKDEQGIYIETNISYTEEF